MADVRDDTRILDQSAYLPGITDPRQHFIANGFNKPVLFTRADPKQGKKEESYQPWWEWWCGWYWTVGKALPIDLLSDFPGKPRGDVTATASDSVKPAIAKTVKVSSTKTSA